VVALDSLPPLFPTHLHSPEFWEQLGRTVATFGCLEEVLGKAIFALTGTVPYDEAERQGAFERWLPTLERALTDPLGGLIESYGKAYHDHPDDAFGNSDDLLDELRRASAIRNSCVTARGGKSQTPKDGHCPSSSTAKRKSFARRSISNSCARRSAVRSN
jgi:hypothetical protein